MARLRIAVVLLMTYFSCAIANDNAETTKLNIIKRETLELASALRKGTFDTPTSKVQLASIANNLVSALNAAANAINNVVPNVADPKDHKILSETTRLVGDFSHTIGQTIPEEPTVIRDTIATLLEKTQAVVVKFEEFNMTNSFVLNQMKIKHDFFLFALYRAKYQLAFVGKTNQDLGSEMATIEKKFADAISSLSTTGKLVETELHHAIQHLGILVAKDAYALENWIEVNSEAADSVKIVQDVAESLSKLYRDVNRKENGETRTLKVHLVKLYKRYAELGTKLVPVKYPDNTGGEEFIRGCLFNGVAFGAAIADTVKEIVATL